MTEQSLASEYAESVASEIWDNDRTGHPFGVVDGDHYAADKAEGEDLDAYDYLASDVLDFRFIVGADGAYLHGEVMLACGGPTVWVSTETRSLEVYWGDHVTRSLPGAFCEAIDECLAEQWESTR